MISIELKLKRLEGTNAQANAIFISGSNPKDWLNEISNWDCNHSSLRILLLPNSINNRDVSGILIFSNEELSGVQINHLSQFYTRVSHLFYPCDAVLSPEINLADLKDLLAPSKTYVWHPGIGLIAFEEIEVLKVHDLIMTPINRKKNWGVAEAGIKLSENIISLSPIISFDIDDLLNDGKEDIGSNSDSLDKLPESPLEPQKGVLNKSINQGKNITAKAIKWISNQLPATADKRTWINDISDWANNQIASNSAGLEASRNKEINRLLHLLESNPDEGLKFALPMAGDAGRGTTTPSNQLSQRNVSYSWDNLGGGKATDYWDLSHTYQYELNKRYRELATREINLGRHRRAAYIYAELLGDYSSAANALVSGNYWREAATLYKKKLNRPLDAADCYRKGSLWTEALSLYEEIGEYEKAGDLYRKLEQSDHAKTAYRKEIDKYLTRHDYLSAADLFEKKLSSEEEAIKILESAWPHSAQANRCLVKLFDKYAEQGNHQQTLNWINRFREDKEPIQKRQAIADFLNKLSNQYSDQSVNHSSSDCLRILLAKWIPKSNESEKRSLLNSLRSLIPSDRLLRRDCDRFLKNELSEKKPKTKLVYQKRKILELVQSIQISTPGNYKTAINFDNTIYAASTHSYQLNLTRCNWEGDIDQSSLVWHLPYGATESKILLTGYGMPRSTGVLLHPLGQELLKRRVSHPKDLFPSQVVAGGIKDMSKEVLAVSTNKVGISSLEVRNGFLNLSIYSNIDKQLGTIALDYALETVVQPQFYTIHNKDNFTHLGLENELLFVEFNKVQDKVTLDYPITSISSNKQEGPCLLTHTFGSLLFWSDSDNGTYLKDIKSEIAWPIGCITNGSYIILAGDNICQVFSSSSIESDLIAESHLNNEQPVAVLPSPHSNRFGIVTDSGKILIYEITT